MPETHAVRIETGAGFLPGGPDNSLSGREAQEGWVKEQSTGWRKEAH